MRLSNFMLHEGRSVPLEDIDILNNGEFELGGTPIYRGLKGSTSSYRYIDPSQHTRVSKDISNYYTWWIDNHPSWKGWPKRSKSLICTTNMKDADLYGDIHRVYLKKGSVVGICPWGDIWSSFVQLEVLGMDGSSFNAFMDRLSRSMKKSVNNYQDFLDLLSLVDDEIEDATDFDVEILRDLFNINNMSNFGYVARRFFKDKYNENAKMEDIVTEMLMPIRFSKKIVGSALPMSREVWSEGAAILVRVPNEIV